MTYVVLGCRCLLVLVFLVSVAGRLHGRKRYADFVTTARRLAPARLSRLPVVVPAGVVACEAAVPVLLTVPGTVLPGFVLAWLLTSTYAVTIGRALARNLAPARAGPRPPEPAVRGRLHRGHVIRNVLLATTAALGFLAGLAAPAAAGPMDMVTAVAVVVASGVIATLILAPESILKLVRPLT